MLLVRQILVRAIVLVRTTAALAAAACLFSLAGCGQRGALYLPTEPAAARRATLPETLMPGPSAPAPAAGASAPASPSQPSSPATSP